MAILRDFEIPGTGLVATNAYHIIVKVNTEKRLNDIPPPLDSSRPDGLTANSNSGPEVYWKAGYVGKIVIEIFSSQEARNEGKNPIGAIAINPTDVQINGVLSSDIKEFDLNFFIDPTSQLSIIDQAYQHLMGLDYYSGATQI
tara:strand:- start:14 stop:442 length:429 start_codon:yes stop_codon:yes gene_type:complete